ncbi:MAG: class I SAM-dependent methyltransferase [Bacteroidota bacterium]
MSKTVNYPETFARFYDVIYARLRHKTDSDFFMNEIARCKNRVLEIGTGTGRFFTEAVQRGADIYGIDVSRSMIDVLKRKLAPEDQFRVTEDDCVTMHLGLKFDLILAPFRVFSHIIEVEQQLAALNNVARHLEPGGCFIFDLYVPNPKMLSEGLDDVMDFSGEYEPGKKLKRYSTMKADLVNQVSSVTMRFVWDEGNKQLEECWDFKMRFYFRYEIEHLIALSDLELVTIYGDYLKSPLESTSKDFIVVCKKK